MRPILFSSEMVQAILSDNKTVTRRVMNPQPTFAPYSNDSFGIPFWKWKDYQWIDGGIGFPQSGVEDYARYKPGDILYVKETWALVNGYDYQTRDFYAYKADGADAEQFVDKWRSPRYMPQVAARIFLRVTNVRVERVQDITEADAKAEGVITNDAVKVSSYVYWYKELWDSINAKRGYGWDANPWVWVIEFERWEKGEEE